MLCGVLTPPWGWQHCPGAIIGSTEGQGTTAGCYLGLGVCGLRELMLQGWQGAHLVTALGLGWEVGAGSCAPHRVWGLRDRVPAVLGVGGQGFSPVCAEPLSGRKH